MRFSNSSVPKCGFPSKRATFPSGAHFWESVNLGVPCKRERFQKPTRVFPENGRDSVCCVFWKVAHKKTTSKKTFFTVQNGSFDGRPILSMFFVFFENPESVVFLVNGREFRKKTPKTEQKKRKQTVTKTKVTKTCRRWNIGNRSTKWTAEGALGRKTRKNKPKN